ncbi:MAG: division/cell wall cluster transcriptional repressor MraZ, partial [Planctomycetota bacterium]
WVVGDAGDLSSNLIRLYTERSFERAASTDGLSLTPDEDEAELETTLFGLASRLPQDAAGRVRLPEDLLELVGLGSEVVLVGAKDRLEIRDRAAWKASRRSRLEQVPALMQRVRQRNASRRDGADV